MNGTWRYAFVYALTALASLFATEHVVAAPANPQVLYAFCPQRVQHPGFCPEGHLPTDVVRGPDGAYYGITQFGGDYTESGLVYRADPVTRKISILHRFDVDSEGEFPLWLKAGSDGNLYGALGGGGKNGDSGNIYRLSLSGEFTILHAYPVSGGSYPTTSAPVEVQGSWFGIVETRGGGATGVFGLAPNGNYRTLYFFPRSPYCNTYASGLVLAPDGNLYGTTASTGASVCGGTIYRIEPNGLNPIFTVLHNFDAASEGYPFTGLTNGPDQALYGTAVLTDGEAMFRMSLDGQFTEMGTFGNAPPDRSFALEYIMPPLVLLPDDHFYGTRSRYVNNSLYQSEIFRLSVTGEYTQLHLFDSFTEGEHPEAALIRGFDNVLYGTNTIGGKNNNGTLFRYIPPPAQ